MEFQIGEKVISKVTNQKLVEGGTYTVASASKEFSPWGTYITYYLVEENQETLIPVSNGFLILESA